MEHKPFICSLILVAALHTVHSQNMPPEIIEPTVPRKDIHLREGNVTLQCHATAKPKAKYWWTFNGDRISNQKFVEVNDSTGELYIDSFSSQGVGNYQCYAENEIPPGNRAVAMSAVITLLKVEFEGAWKTPEATIETKTRDYVKLSCDKPPLSIPEGQFSWNLYKGQNAKGDIKESDRIYIDNEGSLHFTYLKAEDANGKDLLYKCGLYNSEKSSIKLGSEKNLIVEKTLGNLARKAKLEYFTNPAKFLITKNAELECVFSGYPIPTISWKDTKGENITSNGTKYEIQSLGRKLIVKNLKEEDEGRYTCIGSNQGGTGKKPTIFLDVISGPIWNTSLSSQTVAEGKDAVFKCIAHNAVGDKNPISKPIWYKNGGPVPDSEKFGFSEQSTVLTVKNTNKKTDIMCFQCNVSNDIGYEFADGCLNVIDPIVIDVQPLLKQYISKGDIVNLTVIGHTDPAYTLEYRWIFNGKDYKNENPPFIIFDEATMQAYINTSALSDSVYESIHGTYSRELSHTHDSLTVSIDVILIKELPIAEHDVETAGMPLWWIALIAAVTILIIVAILIVLFNRKSQEGTYLLDKRERANDLDPEKDIVDGGFHAVARASDDDVYPVKKSGISPNLDFGDDIDKGDDDESLLEYGRSDYDTSKFNEDGSFIGQYNSKNKTPEMK